MASKSYTSLTVTDASKKGDGSGSSVNLTIGSGHSGSKGKSFGGEGDKSISFQTAASNNSSLSSFNEIVELNVEGHPYIDINRLVYHPHKHDPHNAPHLQKEKLIWYVPDFSFILSNLTTLGISTYFILAGITSLTWVTSIGMFSLPNCEKLLKKQELVGDVTEYLSNTESFYYLPCKAFIDDPEGKFRYKDTGYNLSKDHHSFPIIDTKLTNVQTFGLVLIGLELINIINVIVGINACLSGYKSILVQHVTVDGFIVLGEFVISSIVSFTGICEDRQLEVVRMLLHHHVRWYDNVLRTPEDESDKEKLVNMQVDALQLSLGCCGVDGWMDYLPGDWPYWDWAQYHTDLDGSELVIPASCCRSWWIRNVYCSHGAHWWAHPAAPPEKAYQFQERINQEGCMYKLEQTCEKIRFFMGTWGFLATIIHLIFIIFEAVAALVLIKNINMLILENKKLMKRKELVHDPGDSGSDVSLNVAISEKLKDEKPGKRATFAKDIDKRWTKIPPPTEDEIVTIRQRSNFNRFMAQVKAGFVGKWMKQAHEFVTEGYEEMEIQTEEERKHRDKELLHGKKVYDRQLPEPEDEQKGKGGGDHTKIGSKVAPSKMQKKTQSKVPGHKTAGASPKPAGGKSPKTKEHVEVLWKKEHGDDTKRLSAGSGGSGGKMDAKMAESQFSRDTHDVASTDIEGELTFSEFDGTSAIGGSEMTSMASTVYRKGHKTVGASTVASDEEADHDYSEYGGAKGLGGKTGVRAKGKGTSKKAVAAAVAAAGASMKKNKKKKKPVSSQGESLEFLTGDTDEESEDESELDEDERKRRKRKKRKLMRKRKLRRTKKHKQEAHDMSKRPWINYW